VNPRNGAEQFAREHPDLAAELASIGEPQRAPRVRVHVEVGPVTIRASVLVAVTAALIAAEVATLGWLLHGVTSAGWSPFWWIAVVIVALVALEDARWLSSKVAAIRHAYYIALYRHQKAGNLS
jgi:hypothetical protein